MKEAVKNLAEKMMARAHGAVRLYEEELRKKQELPLAKRNMLYGKYLLNMDEAI